MWDVDWATVSWQGNDGELMRRVLAAWDKHLTHPSLPRRLAARLRDAGFEHIQMDAHPFATTQLIPDAYGGSLAPLLEQYVVEQDGMSQQEAQAWADEQRALGDRGGILLHGHSILLHGKPPQLIDRSTKRRSPGSSIRASLHLPQSARPLPAAGAYRAMR